MLDAALFTDSNFRSDRDNRGRAVGADDVDGMRPFLERVEGDQGADRDVEPPHSAASVMASATTAGEPSSDVDPPEGVAESRLACHGLGRG